VKLRLDQTDAIEAGLNYFPLVSFVPRIRTPPLP
jgi:hypothetical protein